MCGISGIYNKSNSQILNVSQFHDDTERIQSKRGPDFFGSYIGNNKNVCLYHNRLSLVDLSSKGNQPMEKHGYVVTFNGEIYNFRIIKKELKKYGYTFESTTDTEVILSAYHKWGVSSFSKFNGAFAFCLYDTTNNKILLVRDKVGEKPLYYIYNNTKSELSFASNTRVLFTLIDNISFNEDRIISDLVFNFWSDKSETHFNKINAIQAGTYLEFGLNDIHPKIKKYWDIEAFEESIEEQDAINTIESLLESSVSMRVDLDTKIASILSGGIDSSLLSVIGQKYLDYPLDSYTLRKHGFDDEDIISASRLSKDLGWNHHQVQVREKDLSIKNVLEVAKAMEEPVLDQVYIYISRNYEEAHKNGFKAVLNGQGADEIFLGYLDYYPFMRNQDCYKSTDTFHKFWYEQFALKDFINKEKVDKVIDSNLNNNYKPYQTDDKMNSVLRFGTKTHLPALLIQEDKQSLNWSVECRTAYTDYRLVEYLNKIPSKLKYADGKEKYLLRNVAKKYLPEYIINRKKLGFPDLPDGRHKLVAEMIGKGFIKKSELINSIFNDKLFDNVQNLPFPIQWKLCSIAVLENIVK